MSGQFGFANDGAPGAAGEFGLGATSARRGYGALSAARRVAQPSAPKPSVPLRQVPAHVLPRPRSTVQQQPPPPPAKGLLALEALEGIQRLCDNLSQRLSVQEDATAALSERATATEEDLDAMSEGLPAPGTSANQPGPLSSDIAATKQDILSLQRAYEALLEKVMLAAEEAEAPAPLPATITGRAVGAGAAVLTEPCAKGSAILRALAPGDPIILVHPMFEEDGRVWMASPVVDAGTGALVYGYAAIADAGGANPRIGSFSTV